MDYVKSTTEKRMLISPYFLHMNHLPYVRITATVEGHMDDFNEADEDVALQQLLYDAMHLSSFDIEPVCVAMPIKFHPFIGKKPHHPLSFKFPKHEFGKKNTVKRSF